MALSKLCRCVCSSLPTSRPVSLGTKPLSYWEAVRRYVRLQALQGTFLACRLGSLESSIVSFHSVAPELIGGICRHGKATLASNSSPPASLLHQNCVSKRIGDASFASVSSKAQEPLRHNVRRIVMHRSSPQATSLQSSQEHLQLPSEWSLRINVELACVSRQSRS